MIVAFRSAPPSFRSFLANTFSALVTSAHRTSRPFLTPFPATHAQNSPVTPFAATHTNSPSRKSFPYHTYKKQGVSPLGVRRSCRRFRGRQLSAQTAVSARRVTTSPLFSHFT